MSCNSVAYLARPEGFEPPTTAFGGQYSIQLSYGRVVRRIRHLEGPHEFPRTPGFGPG